MGPYQLVYDFVGDAGGDGGWWPAGACLAFAVAVAWLGVRRRGVMLLTCGAVLLAAACLLAWPCWERRELLQALQNGRVKVAEGPLRGYWRRKAETAPGSREWLWWENFTVDGVLFGYYRDRARPGFRNLQALDLPEGLRLRIVYSEPSPADSAARRILRLEVAAGAPGLPSAPPVEAVSYK
jgi:hypothetical protein